MSVKVEIKSERDCVSAVLKGEIDHHSAREVRAEIDSYIVTYQPEKFVIDFKGVTFMDSSGVGLILGRSKLLKECGGELEVRNASASVKRVLKLSGIERIVNII